VSNFRMSARIITTLSCGRDTTIQTNNGLESAILRRKVPINMLRTWALRFREKLLVCVEDCLKKSEARDAINSLFPPLYC